MWNHFQITIRWILWIVHEENTISTKIEKIPNHVHDPSCVQNVFVPSVNDYREVSSRSASMFPNLITKRWWTAVGKSEIFERFFAVEINRMKTYKLENAVKMISSSQNSPLCSPRATKQFSQIRKTKKTIFVIIFATFVRSKGWTLNAEYFTMPYE